MTEKRTLLGWLEYLDTGGRELTLAEFMAVMVMNSREYNRIAMQEAHQQREATEHLEGMVGTLDEFMAGDLRYRQLADQRARPAPMLPDREAS